MNHVILPLLRVRENARGTLDEVPRADPAPIENREEWWQAVMSDWRLRRRSTKHKLDTLGMTSSPTLTIECEACALRRSFNTAELVKLYGRGYFTMYLRHDLAACPRGLGFHRCQVRYAHSLRL